MTSPRSNQQFPVVLKEAAYIPSFHTNIISAYRAREWNIFPDLENRQQYYRDTSTQKRYPFATLTPRERMFVLELNRDDHDTEIPEALFSSSTLPNEKADAYLWHKRLGHPSYDIVHHLTEASRGAIVTDKKQPMSGCTTCHLSKAQRQVSRVPHDPTSRPFEHICVDLMFFEPGYNYHTVAFHLYDLHTGFHIVNSGSTKSIFASSLLQYLNMIERQFGYTVKVISMDNESAFDGHIVPF